MKRTRYLFWLASAAFIVLLTLTPIRTSLNQLSSRLALTSAPPPPISLEVVSATSKLTDTRETHVIVRYLIKSNISELLGCSLELRNDFKTIYAGEPAEDQDLVAPGSKKAAVEFTVPTESPFQEIRLSCSTSLITYATLWEFLDVQPGAQPPSAKAEEDPDNIAVPPDDVAREQKTAPPDKETAAAVSPKAPASSVPSEPDPQPPPAKSTGVPNADGGLASNAAVQQKNQASDRGLAKDDSEAARYKLAADKGNAEAQFKLGALHEHGGGGLLKDDREAARLYKLAADQGNADAQVKLGVFYEQGRGGLPKDDREAARLYKLAVGEGNADAQVNLGVFYEQGRGGLPKEEPEAARLYKLAADQKNAAGQVDLGAFYEQGRGAVPKDDREAARLYKLAADQEMLTRKSTSGCSTSKVAAACLRTTGRPCASIS